MRNVMKYLGIMSVSLACAGPLFATSVQPFAGVTVVQQSVVTVKGQVVDEKGEPIIGANVIVEGTTNGMITDLDGNFSLQCPVGSTLKTSYIGYLARTVKVTGNMNALKITLKEDTETLDEVVVVGYGTMRNPTSPVLWLPECGGNDEAESGELGTRFAGSCGRCICHPFFR